MALFERVDLPRDDLFATVYLFGFGGMAAKKLPNNKHNQLEVWTEAF